MKQIDILVKKHGMLENLTSRKAAVISEKITKKELRT